MHASDPVVDLPIEKLKSPRVVADGALEQFLGLSLCRQSQNALDLGIGQRSGKHSPGNRIGARSCGGAGSAEVTCTGGERFALPGKECEDNRAKNRKRDD